MAVGGLQKRSETCFQMTTLEVMLNRAELFFASVLETSQRHPHIGCEVHTVFLLSWDLVLGLDPGGHESRRNQARWANHQVCSSGKEIALMRETWKVRWEELLVEN